MTKLAIRIDDVYLDLFDESNFYLTRQQRDLRDLSLRNSDYTRSIDVPTTPKNKNVLLPYIQTGVKEIPGSIEIDSISIDSGARFIVKGFDEIFTLNALIDNQNIFSKISGNISELDLEDYEITWTASGVNDIRLKSSEVQYMFAHWMDLESYKSLLKAGLTGWLTDQEIYASGFFIRTRLLFKRIIEGIGLKLNAESLILASDMYNFTSIACPVDKFIEEDEVTVNTERQSVTSNTPYTTSGSRIIFATTDIPGAGLWDSVSDTEYDFVSDANIQVTARIQGFFTDLELKGDFQQPVLQMSKNGAASVVIREFILTQSNQTSFNLSINENIYVENGDELYIQVYWAKGDNVGITIKDTSWFKIASLNSDLTISVNDHLPDISQADFIKGMMNVANMVPVLSAETLYLYDFDGTFETAEYTPVIAENREQPQEYSFSNLFKLSWFKYKDSDLQRDDINFSFRVNDESLPEEGIILDLPFEGCDVINTSYNSNDVTAVIGAYKYEIDSYGGLNGSSGATSFNLDSTVSFEVGDWIYAFASGYIRRITAKTNNTVGTIAGTWASTLSSVEFYIIRIKKNPRPLKIVWQGEEAASYDIFDRTNASPTTLAATGGGGGQPVNKATFNQKMLLGSRAGNEYANLIEALKFPKVLQIWCKIPSYDILDRNFIRRIFYIPKYNERYYINKLEQWNPETQLCRAELIRIR